MVQIRLKQFSIVMGFSVMLYKNNMQKWPLYTFTKLKILDNKKVVFKIPQVVEINDFITKMIT